MPPFLIYFLPTAARIIAFDQLPWKDGPPLRKSAFPAATSAENQIN